jgi:hypothetical protein
MNNLGKFLIITGLFLVVLGVGLSILARFNPFPGILRVTPVNKYRSGTSPHEEQAKRADGLPKACPQGSRIPFLGRLPGDILIQKKNFTFYFPLATSIMLSVILGLILYLVSKIHK